MYIIGLMSGTSADAIDAALCEIQGEPPLLRIRIVKAITYPYPEGFQARIWDACLPEKSRVDTVCQLNFDMGELFAAAANKVIADCGMPASEIDLIGSHGQTIWHMVQPSGQVSATLQITEASIIAERTGITTISNFRPRDIAAGGQGAPLTGYADWLLLRHPTAWRAVQNVGGMGNVTFLPPLSDTTNVPVAFDTGPGNALIDGAMTILTEGKQSYDHNGQLASTGKIDEDWLQTLMLHPYYELKPPKTTGRELFGAIMAQQLVNEGRQRGLDNSGLVATITALTAASIADAYTRYAPAPVDEVIMGGGGARNPALIGLLQSLLPAARVLTHEDIGLDSDNKEALVFALLAHETWHARPGNLPSLTGAKAPVVLGQITPGTNYATLIRRTWC
ncbi:MAG: anhydro-N-acetylmuramic acid kinase [Chloroflexi bacterium]|nr:anhydro-N-acetylmuramic acid kinase [Chloroflexota bacterium]MCC6892247.1 anhydro-N-acetylmuramic acid kinase [Anaerolineae bacterium]